MGRRCVAPPHTSRRLTVEVGNETASRARFGMATVGLGAKRKASSSTPTEAHDSPGCILYREHWHLARSPRVPNTAGGRPSSLRWRGRSSVRAWPYLPCPHLKFALPDRQLNRHQGQTLSGEGLTAPRNTPIASSRVPRDTSSWRRSRRLSPMASPWHRCDAGKKNTSTPARFAARALAARPPMAETVPSIRIAPVPAITRPRPGPLLMRASTRQGRGSARVICPG